MGKYDNLFSPIQITKDVTFRNRIIKSPASTKWCNDDGTVSERLITGYESFAKGGASAVILAAVTFIPVPGVYVGAHDDKFIPGLKAFADAMHKHGCKAILQLHHPGNSGYGEIDGSPSLSASNLTAEEMPTNTCEPGRAITLEEIPVLIENYVRAAERGKEAGFDGIEVHAAHGYFLNNFLSKAWNKRTDQYGPQSVENRTRLIVELFEELRKRLGPDYLIGTRINGQEWGAKGVITIEEAVENARVLEAAGADYINVSGYGLGPLPFRYCPDYFQYPEAEEHMKPYMNRFKGDGLLIEPAAAIKKAVKVPVICAGRMDEDKGEAILQQGKADIIGINRGLWADPELPNKVAAGRIDDIVRCTRCASCEDPVSSPRICRVNPSLGREKELVIAPAQKKKNVMVIGGGPAGMEAARVAALRGHDVTLYEKTDSLGGRTKLAAMLKGSEGDNVMPIYDYLTHQLKKLNIKVKTKANVTLDMIKKENPDAVIVANSSPYPVPDVPGIDRKNVSTVKGLSEMTKLPMKMFGPEKLSSMTHLFLPVGKKVIVLGGQIEGLQGAVFLKKRGREVVVLEESNTTGAGIPEKFLVRMYPWFDQNGVEVITGVKYDEITKDGIHFTMKDGSKRFIEGSVMVLCPQEADASLENEIKKIVPEVYSIGSVSGGDNGLFKHALLDGRTVGCKI